MIRFACPGCGATYAVDDAKGGKTGACPKCQSQFTIPDPDPAAPPPADVPPPLPPAAPSPGTVEIAPCPGCQARLSVAATDLGTDVQCPHCRRVYRAVEGSPAGPPPLPARPSARGRRDDEFDDRPSRRGRHDDDDDDEFDDRSSRRGRKWDDDDDDRPSRRGRGKDDRPSEVGVIGGLMLGGGIYALVQAVIIVLSSGLICCLWPGVYLAIVWGILAIIRASSILNRTDVGGPPQVLCILQIVLIINLDVINLVLGIIGLIMLSNPKVKDYYDRVAPPRDD